jgi:hypothetical protein
VWTRGAAIDRADGSAVLVLVEDGRDDVVEAELGEGVDGESARMAIARDAAAPEKERRADSILLVQWFRRCDAVSITSIPRDLVIEPDGEPVAVLNHTIGPAALAALIERTFDVAIVATSVLDVTDVERLAA